MLLEQVHDVGSQACRVLAEALQRQSPASTAARQPGRMQDLRAGWARFSPAQNTAGTAITGKVRSSLVALQGWQRDAPQAGLQSMPGQTQPRSGSDTSAGACLQSHCRCGSVTQRRRDLRAGLAPFRSGASRITRTVRGSRRTRSVLGRHSRALSSSTCVQTCRSSHKLQAGECTHSWSASCHHPPSAQSHTHNAW